MLYIDKLFINKVSFNLERFRWLNTSVANFRCNLCGDSKKNKRKTRAYFYIAKDGQDYRFCCKNCEVDVKFHAYLRKNFPLQYQEYKLENFRFKGNNIVEKVEIDNSKAGGFIKELRCPTIAQLATDHPARLYLQKRFFPSKHLGLVHYTDSAAGLVADLLHDLEYSSRFQHTPALVFVLRDEDKNIGALNFRYMSGGIRYQIAALYKGYHKVYGLERFNRNKPALIVEGPIDSHFLPNCLAACGSDLRSLKKYVDKDHTIVIFDNEPRNKQIVGSVEKAIEDDFIVYIPPVEQTVKDINDMVKIGVPIRRIIEMIVGHSTRGLRAKIAWQNWKKA